MNPYAKTLGDANAHETIAATPQRLADLIAGKDSASLTHSAAPGKWSIRDYLCHLADTEIAFAFRLRQAIAEENHVIQPFDQEKWGAAYTTFAAASALSAFTAMRNWNCQFLETVPAESYDKRLTHPERGEMAFRTLVETMAGHDLNHLKHIEALVAGAQ